MTMAFSRTDFKLDVGERFRAWLCELPRREHSRVHILCDFDADGLPAGALLFHALRGAGYRHTTAECRRKGESAWSEEVAVRVRKRACTDGLDALIVADLGSRGGAILASPPGAPSIATLLLDHHRPIGQPPGSALITSYDASDEAGDGKNIATTCLLAYWCAEALVGSAKAEPWLWLAGVSLLSDLGDKAPFEELREAKARFGGGALREATSLLNAPRRTAEGRADAALSLLLKSDGPKDVISGRFPETAKLLRAKEEVSLALATARKQPPRFSQAMREELGADLVAVRIDTPCQVHPLVAQQWRGRFPKSVVLGVNVGYRPGWVSFSGRAPAGVNLIEFLARHRPPEADNSYGLGHNQASGGSLPVPVWNRWIQDLGFGSDLIVDETKTESQQRDASATLGKGGLV